MIQKHVKWSSTLLTMPKSKKSQALTNQIQALFSFPSSQLALF